MPVDAYVELGEGCGQVLEKLRILGFKLALARILSGCGAAMAPQGVPRIARYSDGARGIGLAEFGHGIAEVLLVRLGTLRLDALGELLGKRPNVVRAIVIRFSEIRELAGQGRLSIREIGDLFELALDYHAPLLVGSGARRPEELLGPRALYSALRLIDPDLWARSDYRRAIRYLYERAVIG
ncbi:MAG: hypothetical protein ACP5NG_03030 [Conexivisphaera sp.]